MMASQTLGVIFCFHTEQLATLTFKISNLFHEQPSKMALRLALLQGDKGAPGTAGLYGEIGPTGDFGKCCPDGENRTSIIWSLLGKVIYQICRCCQLF